MSVTILRGYPASGKSTYAQALAGEGGYIIVSRDIIRAQVAGTDEETIFDYESENFVTKIADAQARAALDNDWSVIIDDTNLRRKHARRWANLAIEYGTTYEVIDFKTPLEVCLGRNLERGLKVHPSVIENYALKFPLNNWPEIVADPTPDFPLYERDISLPPGVIFDLDGTLCDMGLRDPYDASTCEEDIPREAVIAALDWVPWNVQPIFVSGRSEDFREETRRWIIEHTGVIPNHLLMRPSGDNRKDAIVKSELFDKYIAPYFNVLHIYDDRDQVIEMWAAKGLDVFDVDPMGGDF